MTVGLILSRWISDMEKRESEDFGLVDGNSWTE